MKHASLAGPAVLIIGGSLLLINNLNWGLDLGELIRMWWPMVIIVPGVNIVARGLIQGTQIGGGLIMILVGAAFQLHKFYPALSVGELFRTYWPLALIAVGLSQLLVFGRGRWYGRVHDR